MRHFLLILFAGSALAQAEPVHPGEAVLQKACVKCHKASRAKGGLDLEAVLAVRPVEREYHTWQRIRAMLEVDGMPPRRKLSKAHHADAMAFLEDVERRALQNGGGAGREPIRRLTREELGNSLRDLLGHGAQVERLLPSELVVHGGFEASSATVFVHATWLERASVVIEQAVRQALPESGPSSLGAGVDDVEKARGLAMQLAHRAWRRPLDEAARSAVLAPFARALAAGEAARGALRSALQTMLVSPSFLMRIEDAPVRGPGVEEGSGERPVNAHALASRLSYFLWSSLPDKRLMKLASDGTLVGDGVLRSEVSRLLRSSKSLAFGRSFASQWLAYRGLGTRIKPDPIDNPFMTDSLMADMREEVARYVHRLFVESSPFEDLLVGKQSYLSKELATFYRFRKTSRRAGLPAWVNVERDYRHGLLGKAAILMSTSYPDRTSPVLRGAWVLERLLGLPPPPPPPDAGEFDGELEERDLSLREMLEHHRGRKSCAACHDRIDPLGFALEGFDRFGRWRRADTEGSLPSGASFEGVVELGEVLMRHHAEDMAREASRRLLAYALGRPLGWQDERTVRELAVVLRKGGWRALLEAVVLSRPFRFQQLKD